MPTIFIAGTGTDVGKTYVTTTLLHGLKRLGRAVEALKPVVSGFDEDAPAGSDPALLLGALGLPVTRSELDRISPWRYGTPLAPNQAARLEGRRVDGEAVIAHCRSRGVDAGQALLLIEGAGGIMSPLDDDLTMLDLARRLATPVALVAGSYLGTISHTLTAAEVILRAGLELKAIIVSETEGGPSLADTLSEIAKRLGQIPLAVVPRGDDGSHGCGAGQALLEIGRGF